MIKMIISLVLIQFIIPDNFNNVPVEQKSDICLIR